METITHKPNTTPAPTPAAPPTTAPDACTTNKTSDKYTPSNLDSWRGIGGMGQPSSDSQEHFRNDQGYDTHRTTGLQVWTRCGPTALDTILGQKHFWTDLDRTTYRTVLCRMENIGCRETPAGQTSEAVSEAGSEWGYDHIPWLYDGPKALDTILDQKHFWTDLDRTTYRTVLCEWRI